MRNSTIFAVGTNLFQTSENIKSDYTKNAPDMTRAHMLHKPYTNDFSSCLDKVAKAKLDTGGPSYDGT